MKRARLENLADEELVRLFRQGAEEPDGRAAASVLFQRYRDRLYNWCYRRMGSHEAALDLAQETLLAAFQALPRFEGRAAFSSWLFAIARNRCVSAWRSARPDRVQEEDLDRLPDPAPDPEALLLRRLEEDAALALVEDALDPEERLALWMRCYEGTSVDEITRHLGLTGSAGARALLQRARRKLRAALERHPAAAEGGLR